MFIVKKGNTEKKPYDVYKFKCSRCGCVWIADYNRRECHKPYSIGYSQYDGLESSCPTCNSVKLYRHPCKPSEAEYKSYVRSKEKEQEEENKQKRMEGELE